MTRGQREINWEQTDIWPVRGYKCLAIFDIHEAKWNIVVTTVCLLQSSSLFCLHFSLRSKQTVYRAMKPLEEDALWVSSLAFVVFFR